MTPQNLARARELLEAGDPNLARAFDALRTPLQAALARGPFSVTSKTMRPPSGDKHDYVSVGPYWWPNPATPDGLPYVRRDGELNPERANEATDWGSLANLTEDVEVALLVQALSPDKEMRLSAGAHAVKLLRAWFLNAETRMNPHLRYGQAIPGITEGRGIGIIDTTALVGMLRLLMSDPPPQWTDDDDANLKAWFSEYLDWLLASDLGEQERREHNNHGSWWDAQAAWFGIYCGRPTVGREIARTFLTRRIAEHIEPDGSQPHELARTRPITYCCYNLQSMMHMADAAATVGIDLWHAATADGQSIRVAAEWFLTQSAWSSAKLDGPDVQVRSVAPVLRRAAIAFEDNRFEQAIRAMPGGAADQRFHLTYPPKQST